MWCSFWSILLNKWAIIMKKIVKTMHISIPCTEIDDVKYLVFDKKEIQQSFWAYGRYYEENMVEFIRDNYKGGTFIDVGSSIGNHTIYFSKLADKVYSFEPIHFAMSHQVLNLIANKTKNVILYNIALGDKQEIKKIFHDGRCVGGGTIDDEKGDIVIPVFKLDAFEIKDVKLIKIDVEGYELKVLKGAKKTIKKYKPDIFVECATEQMLKDVGDYINPMKLGYSTFPIQFNNTPTFLLTTKKHNTFKVRKKDDD